MSDETATSSNATAGGLDPLNDDEATTIVGGNTPIDEKNPGGAKPDDDVPWITPDELTDLIKSG